MNLNKQTNLIQLILNIFTKWSNQFVNIFLGIFLIPIYLKYLGKDGFGIISLLILIVSYSSLLDFGLRSSLSRFLTEKRSEKNTKEYNQLITTSLYIYIFLSLFIITILNIFIDNIIAFFNIPLKFYSNVKFLIQYYISFNIFVSFLTPIVKAVIISHNRFDIINNIQTLSNIIYGVLIVLFLSYFKLGINGWVVASIVKILFEFFIFLWISKQIIFQVKLNLFCLKQISNLLKLGVKLFVLNVMDLISIRSDPIIISHFFGPAGVALYRPGLNLSRTTNELVSAIRNQLYALTVMFQTTGENKKNILLLLNGTKFSFLFAILLNVILIIYADTIIGVWLRNLLNNSDYKIATIILMCWGIINILNSSSGTQWSILFGINKLDFLLLIQIITGIVNIIISYILVGYSHFGIIGALLPTILMGIIRRPILTIYTANVCKISPYIYFQESYLGALFVLLLLLLGSYLIKLFVRPMDIIQLIICSILTMILWGILVWLVGFTDKDKTICLNVIQHFKSYFYSRGI